MTSRISNWPSVVKWLNSCWAAGGARGAGRQGGRCGGRGAALLATQGRPAPGASPSSKTQSHTVAAASQRRGLLTAVQQAAPPTAAAYTALTVAHAGVGQVAIVREVVVVVEAAAAPDPDIPRLVAVPDLHRAREPAGRAGPRAKAMVGAQRGGGSVGWTRRRLWYPGESRGAGGQAEAAGRVCRHVQACAAHLWRRPWNWPSSRKCSHSCWCWPDIEARSGFCCAKGMRQGVRLARPGAPNPHRLPRSRLKQAPNNTGRHPTKQCTHPPSPTCV